MPDSDPKVTLMTSSSILEYAKWYHAGDRRGNGFKRYTYNEKKIKRKSVPIVN
jgi:hypothetical protein